jgi:hypothetical protein
MASRTQIACGPRNIFVGKSARIIRSLLTDRDRVWTQAEIVRRTGASSGLVSVFLTLWSALGAWHSDLVLVSGLVPKP